MELFSVICLVFGVVSSMLPVSSTGPSVSLDNYESFKNTNSNRHIRSVPHGVRESCLSSADIQRNRVNTTDRLRRLRLRMKASNYDAYVIPSTDEHQSEFIADYDKRRQFITGFTGSAGTAVVLLDAAALWTDGRYFLQAEKELDCNWILMKKNVEGFPTIYDWVLDSLKPGSNIGADFKLIPYREWLFLKEKVERGNITLVADQSNLVDDIWSIPQGRVPESVSHVFVHDVKYAGKSWEQKVQELRNLLHEKQADAIIVTALDEIAWLFNLRSSDELYTPIFKSYAFISKDWLKLFIKHLKLTTEVEKYLCPNVYNSSECVKVSEYNNAFEEITNLISDCKTVLISSDSSYAVVSLIPKKKQMIDLEASLISSLKVIKNPVEIAGMKNAAMKDSVAIIDFLAMLESEVTKGKHWDEIKASKTLSKYRKEQQLNKGESFETISAFGPNAAIIHYSPETFTNRDITKNSLYLLDSGGQYLDGTTDITRTLHFGEPSDFEMETYTRVLMGVIDLITVVFPDGTRDTDLDIIARRPLYGIGLDYLHGTGHGIGSFLGVHEGPISIRHADKNSRPGYALKPGMILSNEPGFYVPGKYGIRLETMMMVVNAQTPHKFQNKYYTLEPISFVPFEPKLIDLRLLSKKQIEWLNWYNMKTRNSVGLELQRQTRKRGFRWLLSKTEFIPIAECINRGRTLLMSKISLLLCSVLIPFMFL